MWCSDWSTQQELEILVQVPPLWHETPCVTLDSRSSLSLIYLTGLLGRKSKKSQVFELINRTVG